MRIADFGLRILSIVDFGLRIANFCQLSAIIHLAVSLIDDH